MKICAIAAMDQAGVIGLNGALPWRISSDLKRFSELTTGHTVLMGRKTWDSLPIEFRPLPNRHNIVLTRQIGFDAPQVEVWGDLQKCLSFYKSSEVPDDFRLKTDILWIIGGAQIYKATMPYWHELYLTVVRGTYLGDAYFPDIDPSFHLTTEEEFSEGVFRSFKRNIS